MKKIYLFSIVFILTCISHAQTPFTMVELHGFEPHTMPPWPNGSVTDIKTFKNKLYVGLAADSGQVYRSATGDAGTFQCVFPSRPLITRAGHLETTNDGPTGGYLFMAGHVPSGYGAHPKVFRTSDGVVWDDYADIPIDGYTSNIRTFKGLGAEDSVYVAQFSSSTGTILMRNGINANDYDNTLGTWDTVANFLTEFGTFSQMTASAVFNGSLYYTLEDNNMYTTGDGRSLSQSVGFSGTIGATSGLNNAYASAMEVYGGSLYIGTYNYTSGCELWLSNNGTSFANITSPLFSGFNRIVRMKSTAGKLWMLLTDGGGAFGVFSWDGTTVAVENTIEFGSANIDIDSYSGLEEFNDHLYVGVTHYQMPSRYAQDPTNTFAFSMTNGAQVWRTCLIGANPNLTVTSPNPEYVCPGATATVTVAGNAASYIWHHNGATTLSTTTSDTGFFQVTGIGANTCRTSTETNVRNFTPGDAPVFSLGNTPTPIWGNSLGFCMGDTSPVVVARDPVNDYNALHIPSIDGGFSMVANNDFASDKSMTIELWFKPISLGVILSEFDTLTASSWSYNNNSVIRLDFGGSVYISLPGLGGESWIGDIISNFGGWHHVTVRYNGTTGDFDGALDGVFTGPANFIRSIPEDNSGYDSYKIGMTAFVAALGYNVSNMNGYVRDIRIWNSVRTNSEISDNLYGLPVGTYPDLVYYFKAEETSGTVLNDSSGNAFNATINGAFVTPVSPILWTASPTLTDLGNAAAEFHPVVPTNYTAQYTDANGCPSAPGILAVSPYYLDITPSVAASCGGQPAFLAYTTNASMITTTWSSTTLGTVPTNSVNITPPSAEWVYVSTNVGGTCALEDSILVNVGPAFESTLGNPLPVFDCEGAQIVMDAEATGGTAPFTFIWYNSMFSDTTTVDTLIYTIPPGYVELNLHATDAIGCYYNLGLSTSATPSTDLHGHVSTPPPSSLDVDNGFVYVFKHQPGSAGLDTMGYTPLDANGDYLFTPLTAGSYLIKVLPDETAFPLGVPTYYGNTFQWDSSTVYTHGCSQADTADIQLVMMDGSTGTASVSGYILEGPGFGTSRYGNNNGQPNLPFVPGGPLKGIDVKLGKNPGGGIQARVMSDSTGFYEFENVPDGGYKIYVDIPNLPMDSTRELVIAIGDSSIQNNYFADSAIVYVNPDTVVPVGIYASTKVYENNFTIYPNPAKGNLYVSYELTHADHVAIEIRNAIGQLIRAEPSRKHPEGKNIFIFNTDQLNLQNGVYFISVLTGNKKYTQRLVVID
jgi:hypothetical protein